jgi:hypothetical protein
MAKPRYNDDPSVISVPLSVDEAGWVVANPKSLKGVSHIEHFARRALATANSCVAMRINFDNELRRRTSSAGQGSAANLSPEAAARFLSPDQLAGLFDRLSQDKLAQLEAQRKKAEETRTQAINALEGVALHLRSSNPSLGDTVAMLEDAVRKLKENT